MVSFFILCPIINLIHTSFAPALSMSEAKVCLPSWRQVFHFEFSHAHVKIAIHVGSVGVMISKLVIDQVFLVCVVAVLDERYKGN